MTVAKELPIKEIKK